MRITKFPSCCSVNIIHDFYDISFKKPEDVKKELKYIIEKAKKSYNDYLPVLSLIILSELQFRLLEDLLKEEAFFLLLKTKGQHGEDIYLLGKHQR